MFSRDLLSPFQELMGFHLKWFKEERRKLSFSFVRIRKNKYITCCYSNYNRGFKKCKSKYGICYRGNLCIKILLIKHDVCISLSYFRLFYLKNSGGGGGGTNVFLVVNGFVWFDVCGALFMSIFISRSPS